MTKIEYSFQSWCLDNEHQDWLDLWDYERNAVSPDQISAGSHKKLWFLCQKGIHDSFQREIRLLTRGDSSVSCRKCNSIGQFLIDAYGNDALERMWSDKNTVDPFDVAKGNSKSKIWLKCDKDPSHPDSEYLPCSVLNGALCKACSGVAIITGKNDVATLHPDLLKYFKNPQDARTTGRWTERTVDLICPDCGRVVKKRVCDLVAYRFNCPICGDTSSYPNKFVYSFLLELRDKYCIEIFPEHVFEWSKNLGNGRKCRIYDFYIKYNDVKIIVEVHGRQHYDGSFSNFTGAKTLQDEIENDSFKRKLALEHGISPENYIVIDARESTSDWIRSSILHSRLADIFCFDGLIDWRMCDLNAQKSLVHVAADLWNANVKSSLEVSKRINRSMGVTISYLRKASKLGLCDYKPGYSMKYNRRPVFCSSNNIMFSSIRACSEYSMDVLGIPVNENSLANHARNNTTYLGKQFEYVTREQFDSFYNSHPDSTYLDEYFIPTTLVV